MGSVDSSAIDSLKENGLFDSCDFLGYLSHSKTIDFQKKSPVLLLLVNNSPNAMGIQTGKVFEYLAARRPILAVGPMGGNTQQLIVSTNSGIFLPFDDVTRIEEGIGKFWDWYKRNWIGYEPTGIERYSRKELTHRMALLFDKISKEQKKLS